MRIRVEEEDGREEMEVVIFCGPDDGRAAYAQQLIHSALEGDKTFKLRQGNAQYYVPLSAILFFETSGSRVQAHTASEIYETDRKLYQLEESLPGCFLRISKSTIINVNQVFGINRSLASSGAVEFLCTHKQVYVSRRYYKLLKERLDGRRSLRPDDAPE